MLLRVLPLLIALLLLGAPSHVNAALVSPNSSAFSPPENASTAFFESGSESRIGLLCHNDPINRTDPFGLEFTDHRMEVVANIPGHPELVGLTEFKTNIALTMTQTSGGFRLGLGRFDVTVTSKQVATTANGRERTESAVQATKDHENKHVSTAKALHDSVQRGQGIPKTTYRTEQEARAAAKSTGDGIKAKVENQQDNLGNKNAHQGPEWKGILDREKGYK